ncbi:hypothetical protein [Sphingomonas sp. LHG3406-1]|uniref:hypothetical protein n=1 Tax=Sphingomonas sp. LHG3406-1 TaxID=2804617 RepID=UPI0026350134|nr:hypothetical protein [Sphingomonas sp. LHG3406-1]
MNRKMILGMGALAAVAVAELHHGLLGGAEVEARIEQRARNLLFYYDLPQISARMDEKPLSRRLILAGPADDFQRRALVEKMGELPGVNEVRWAPGSPVVDYWAERRRRRAQQAQEAPQPEAPAPKSRPAEATR